MGVLYFLEGIRMPGLNEFMLAVTTLGEETAFLVLALTVFWCVDKRKGYLLLAVGFVGTIANQFLKLLFRIPRPWVLDENFTILEAARDAADGYSFPSGHTQMAVGTFGSIGATAGKKTVKWIAYLLAALVAFSRMYIGVHTPWDVGVSVVLAVVLILVIRSIVMSGQERKMKLLLAGVIGLAVLFLLYVEFWPFPENIDSHNLESGYKNAYTMLGCTVGAAIVYAADKKLDFSVKAVWWAQILKVVLGLGLVLAVKEGLRTPLETLFAGHMAARAVRYFLIVVVAGILWPMTFRYFGRRK